MPDHGLNKDDIRAEMQRACATAHGQGSKLSLLELCAMVLKDGLPWEPEFLEKAAPTRMKLRSLKQSTASKRPELGSVLTHAI